MFNENLDRCLADVTSIRRSYSLPGSTGQIKRKRGPPVRSVKVKVYHLPEAGNVPRFNNCPRKGRDSLLIEHMERGFGEIIIILFYYENTHVCRSELLNNLYFNEQIKKR